MKPDILGSALEAERAGDFDEAASSYFALGALHLSSSDYTNSASMRKGLAYVLQAISLDVRARKLNRARKNALVLDRWLPELIEQQPDPVVTGLAYEWWGDAHLMLGESDALEHYDEAIAQFEALDFETQLHWGARPEYDTAFGAAEDFLEARDIEYFERHDIAFAERVEWKVDVASELLDDEE